jgi:hypothetical protein
MKNPLYRSNSYFSGQNLAKFRPPKKKKPHPNLHITYPAPAQIPPTKMVYFSVGWKFGGGGGGVREECGGKERDLTGKIVRRAANHHFNCLIAFA